nr:CueP family metal-binding protein [Brachybacterium sp. Z12]
MEELEALPLADRPTDLMAAVLPDRLDLSDASGRQTSLSLSDEDFYVSIAPFVGTTHDCFHHSLTTCVGELQEQELEVRVVAADGTVLVDEMRTTAPNGFLGLWLPRDQELALTLTQDGASASTPVATTADSPTCLTTMQLTD